MPEEEKPYVHIVQHPDVMGGKPTFAGLIKLAGCDAGASCPAVYRTDDKIIIVGSVSDDPDVLAKVGEGEQAVEISVQLWDQAREVFGVMPPSESADGFVSAEGPLQSGDGGTR